MLGDRGTVGRCSKTLVQVTTTNVLQVRGRGDVIMMSLVGPCVSVIISPKLRIHILHVKVLELECKNIVENVVLCNEYLDSKLVLTDLLILVDRFSCCSFEDFINSLLFTDIILLLKSLSEPVWVGHTGNRILNLQLHKVTSSSE